MYSKTQAILNGKDTNANFKTFLSRDVAEMCGEAKMHNAIISEIYNFYKKGYSVEDCKKEVEKDLESIQKSKDGWNTIIVAASYVPIAEYSPAEYHHDIYGNPDGKELPVEETLDKYSKMLEELGFININHLINYDMKVAFIYPNDASKKVIDYINTL